MVTTTRPATLQAGDQFDIVIIGGGTMGLAAAYYASSRGLSTLLLEQFDSLADPHASSSGHSRMFRIMYSPGYMARLAEVALALWEEVEATARRVILQRQPLLFYGAPGNTVEGNLGEMRSVLRELGAPFNWYADADALRAAFPALRAVPQDYVGLSQPNSAVIRVQESLGAFVDLARSAGAVLLTGQQARITGMVPGGPYQVSCQAGTVRAKHLVLCPSAWTNRVLQPFGLQLNLSIWQMTLAYFAADTARLDYPLWYEFGGPPAQPRPERRSFPHRLHAPGAAPAVGDAMPHDLFYGFPATDEPNLIKVSADFTNSVFADPSQCSYTPDPAILQEIGAFLQKRFYGVQPEAQLAKTCLYTMSSDYQMILDQLPGHPNVAIFSGDSGRGFKYTPLFGRILVDLATSGRRDYDITPFSIERNGVITRT